MVTYLPGSLAALISLTQWHRRWGWCWWRTSEHDSFPFTNINHTNNRL